MNCIHRSLFPAIVLSMALIQACKHTEEPERPVPANWQIWSKEGVSFRFPPDHTVLTEDLRQDYFRVFLNAPGNPGKLMLYFDLGVWPPCPVMKASRSIPGGPAKTRIHGNNVDRYGPAAKDGGQFCEGMIDLGGDGHVTKAHFVYSRLDPSEQQIVETIIASLQKQR